MGTYYAVQGGSRILNAIRVDQSGADNANVTAWTKANDFIIAINIYSDGKDTAASQYKLRWRDTDGGTFADVASTGAINYSADTDLVNGASIAVGGRKCSTQGDTWQAGEEVEGASLCDSIDLADDYETEIHFALDSSGATDGHTYEFELWNATQNAGKGTCGATITMAAGTTTETKVFSVDGYLVNRHSKDFNVDGYLVDRLIKEFSVDGYLINRLSKEFTIDGHLINRLIKDFSIDGYVVDRLIKEFSIDTILKSVESKDFSINAILEATDVKEFNIDAILVAVGIKEFSIDVYPVDRLDKEFTVDGYLINKLSKEFTVDGLLVNRYVKDFSIDTTIKSVEVKEFTIDGILSGTTFKDFSIDSILKLTSIKEFSVDAVLVNRLIKEFSINGILNSTDSKDFTINAVLVDRLDKTFSIDAILEVSVAKTKTFSVDVVLINRLSKEFSIDALSVWRYDKDFSINGILEATHTKEFTVNALLEITDVKEFSIDGILEKTSIKEFSIDGILSGSNIKTFTIDTVLTDRYFKTFSVDAILEGVNIFEQVGALLDNVQEENDSSIGSSTQIQIGFHNNSFDGGFRWTTVAIPKNAIINSATLGFYLQYDWNALEATIKGIAEDNTPTFSQSSRPSQRSKTSASVNADEASWGNWGVGNWITIDIKDIIAEITSRDGWVSGNALAIVVINDEPSLEKYMRVRGWLWGDGSDAGKLQINYTPLKKEYSIVPSYEFQYTITPLYEQQYYLTIISDEE